MLNLVYRSDHLLVKVAHRGSDVCVVTFDAYTDNSDLDRPAFAERFLKDHQISAVHVVNGRNRWYHEPDWQDAIRAVRQSSQAYRRIVTYGSSMGGYAALAFAGHLGAQSVLALSPQYSRDPRKVPFETRWAPHSRERWLPELSGLLPSHVAAIIAYDPMVSADRKHADCIAREMPVSRLALPYAGHGSAAFLAEVGLLVPLVLSFIEGKVDLVSLARSARDRRRQSSQYLIALAETAHAKGFYDVALRLTYRATVVSPLAEGPWHSLGRMYACLGKLDESLAAHRKAAEIAPDLPAVRFSLAIAQRRVGDFHGALQTLTQLTRLPLPSSSARKVNKEIWSTRALLCLASSGLLQLVRVGRSKIRGRGRSSPSPCSVGDGVEARGTRDTSVRQEP
ncbi:tetratricopeptide repeat protein [Bosea sp. (in: a-proteobacteria)]|uniref:tetratricopeptide repeat protein n=1 Tax=Bosea sp. (in: a-proteobacteria) TaxID=1871050 RepID=UPI003F72BF6B